MDSWRETDVAGIAGPTPEPPYSSQAQRPYRASPTRLATSSSHRSLCWFPVPTPKGQQTNQGSKWIIHPELNLKDIKKNRKELKGQELAEKGQRHPSH